jgi:hypothetical protein
VMTVVMTVMMTDVTVAMTIDMMTETEGDKIENTLHCIRHTRGLCFHR